MNVTLRQLRAFIAVAASASFTEAAARLHVTQSALSGLIKELEQTLGVKLLHRSTRKVQLSDVGAEFLPLATRILEDLDQALGTITELKALRTGIVRVSMPQLLACTLMPQMMSSFARKHPHVKLVLADSMADAVLPRLRTGEVDLALGAEREQVPDLEARHLFEMPFVAVLPVEHPLARRRRLTWADLADQPLISVAGEYTRMLNTALAAAGSQTVIQPAMEVAFMTTALSLVSTGLGITTCQPYAQSLIRLYGLKTRPLDEPRITRSFYVYSRKDRKLSPAAQAFADYLVAQGARLQPRL
ncbi:MAG TPA: LysR family transcriptional regulator [Variovorax sp.]|nr:LysR family transcriptional regulator [Variovorax sp.]